jgi:hypothetical protein
VIGAALLGLDYLGISGDAVVRAAFRAQSGRIATIARELL